MSNIHTCIHGIHGHPPDRNFSETTALVAAQVPAKMVSVRPNHVKVRSPYTAMITPTTTGTMDKMRCLEYALPRNRKDRAMVRDGTQARTTWLKLTDTKRREVLPAMMLRVNNTLKAMSFFLPLLSCFLRLIRRTLKIMWAPAPVH